MLITTWIVIVVLTIGTEETLNCAYPRYGDKYDGKGFMCNWDESDFDNIDEKYILKKKNFDDNYFEFKARQRYYRIK